MCGRFALAAPRADLFSDFLIDTSDLDDFPERYNISPGTEIPVIRQSPEGLRVLQLLRWGLVPHWVKAPSQIQPFINARAESLLERKTFAGAFRKRRCLIPASGFYEWKVEGKAKQPYYISLASNKPMAMAGLWESWTAPDGAILRTVCVITTEANALMREIHERMPVIIPTEHWTRWFSGLVDDVLPLLAPYTAEAMQAWPVDRRVNRVSEEGKG